MAYARPNSRSPASAPPNGASFRSPLCGGRSAPQRRFADGVVGIRRVLDVPHRPFRHVASRAVRAAAALGGLVALEALGPIVSSPFRFRRSAMRIVARAAPQPVAAGPLARALGQRLEMARHVHVRAAGPFKNHHRVREASARPKSARPRAGDARFPRQVALGTHAVAAIGRKLRGVDHLAAPGHVRVARSVAALARNTALEKWRRAVSVGRPRRRLQAAGVAFQADRPDAPRQVEVIVLLVAGRKIPPRRRRVPRDGRLVQKTVHPVEITPPHGPRADKILELPPALYTRRVEAEPRGSVLPVDTVGHARKLMSKRPFRFDPGDPAAAARHPGRPIRLEYLPVAGGAPLAPRLAAKKSE